MTTTSYVSVFTMTYNQRAKLLALVDDLSVQDWPMNCFEFVVLDDGSTDGTADALEMSSGKLPYSVRVLRRSHEADYLSAHRWNECIAASNPLASIFIQVDDVRLRSDFLSRHVAWHEDPDLKLVTGAKFEGDDITWNRTACRRAHLAGPGGEARQTDLWTACWGASLSYSYDLISLLSTSDCEAPFDSRMTGWGFHEVEFAFRAVRAGARLVYDPAVGVFHQNHTPVNDHGRGIDHAAEKESGARRNEQYIMDKHGLNELPRW